MFFIAFSAFCSFFSFSNLRPETYCGRGPEAWSRSTTYDWKDFGKSASLRAPSSPTDGPGSDVEMWDGEEEEAEEEVGYALEIEWIVEEAGKKEGST